MTQSSSHFQASVHVWYDSRSICVYVYLSVAMLSATYLIYTSKLRCHGVLCGIFQICNVWHFGENALLKSFGAVFADYH